MTLEWQEVNKEVDESGLVAVVRRARLPGDRDYYIYSMQIGIEKEGRINPFIPMQFDKESLRLTSTKTALKHDISTIVSSLAALSVSWVVTESDKELANRLYERDAERAKKSAGPATRRTGKTDRERNKKKSKTADMR